MQIDKTCKDTKVILNDKEVVLMNLNTAIYNYLQDSGISKSYVAKETGITPNALNLSLKGKRKFAVDEYIKICDILKVPYDFFVNEKSA